MLKKLKLKKNRIKAALTLFRPLMLYFSIILAVVYVIAESLHTDYMLLLLILFWSTIIWINDYVSRISIVNGIILLAIIPVLLSLQLEPQAEALGNLAYTLLLIGTLQYVFGVIKYESK